MVTPNQSVGAACVQATPTLLREQTRKFKEAKDRVYQRRLIKQEVPAQSE